MIMDKKGIARVFLRALMTTFLMGGFFPLIIGDSEFFSLAGAEEVSHEGRIVFASDCDNPKVNFEIYVMNADGSNVQRLTNTNGGEWSPDWTAVSHSVEPNGKLNITWGEIKRRISGQ